MSPRQEEEGEAGGAGREEAMMGAGGKGCGAISGWRIASSSRWASRAMPGSGVTTARARLHEIYVEWSGVERSGEGGEAEARRTRGTGRIIFILVFFLKNIHGQTQEKLFSTLGPCSVL